MNLIKGQTYKFEFKVMEENEVQDLFLKLIFNSDFQKENGIEGIRLSWDDKEKLLLDLIAPIKEAILQGKI